MEQKYPFKCVKCGFCCLSETCPIGQKIFSINAKSRCPALFFNDSREASCKLAESEALKGIIGIGTGCDILAVAGNKDFLWDYSSLPKDIKLKIVEGVIQNDILLMNRKEFQDAEKREHSRV